jgi:hypothetical protein
MATGSVLQLEIVCFCRYSMCAHFLMAGIVHILTDHYQDKTHSCSMKLHEELKTALVIITKQILLM